MLITFALISGVAATIITVPITAGISPGFSRGSSATMPFVVVTWIFVGARKILTKL